MAETKQPQDCSFSSAESEIFTTFDLYDDITKNLKTMLEGGLFFDVALISGIDDVKVEAHRVILSLASDFFLKMLSSNLTESKTNEVRFKNIDGNTLKLVVRYLYEGTIEISGENVEKIYSTADFLQISKLKEICCIYLGKQLNPSNCLGIAFFADKYNITDLNEKSIAYVCERFEEVSKESEFFELSYTQLNKFLEVDIAISQIALFRGLLAWIDYDQSNRKEFICSVLSHVDFTLLTPEIIVEKAESLLGNSESCRLMHRWLKWRLSSCTLLLINEKFGDTYQYYNSESKKWLAGEWSTSVEMPRNYSAFAVNEKMFIVGGICYKSLTKAVSCFDLNEKKWATLGPSNYEREFPALCKLDGKLCAVGGRNLYDSWTVFFESFDFLSHKWIVRPCLPFELKNVQAATLNNLLYAVGTGGTLIHSFNTITLKWTSIPCNEFSDNFSMAAVKGRLYFVGKVHTGDSDDTIKQYNPNNNSWSLIKSPAFTLKRYQCLNFNNKLVVYDIHTPLIAEYDDVSEEWNKLPPLLFFDPNNTYRLLAMNK